MFATAMALIPVYTAKTKSDINYMKSKKDLNFWEARNLYIKQVINPHQLT